MSRVQTSPCQQWQASSAGGGTGAITKAGDRACTRLNNGGGDTWASGRQLTGYSTTFIDQPYTLTCRDFVSLVTFVREQYGRDRFQGLLCRTCLLLISHLRESQPTYLVGYIHPVKRGIATF